MNFEEQNQSQEDMQVAEALRHFRESMRAWSEVEYTKPRLVAKAKRKSLLTQLLLCMTTPLAGWGCAALVFATSVGVPVSIHRQHIIAAQQHEELIKERKQAAEQARLAAIDDDALMSHVDSDIAQDVPDAMQPLSSMMNPSR